MVIKSWWIVQMERLIILRQMYYELGAEVIEIGTDPNGININEKCGATDVKALQEKCLKLKRMLVSLMMVMVTVL